MALHNRSRLDALALNYDLTPPLDSFELTEQGVNNTTSGLHTGAGDLIWKTYATQRNAQALLYEHRLLEWVSRQGLPFSVPVPLPTRAGATALFSSSNWHALFPRLPGRPPDRHDARQAAAVGGALAQLHGALSGYSIASRPGMATYGDLERVHPHLPNPFDLTIEELGLAATPEHTRLLDWWRAELAMLRGFILGSYRALPWQVIHGDFAPANTLFEGQRLVAILDFEFATADARALDLAAGLVFTLRVWEGAPQRDVARAFLDGYRRVMLLEEDEIAALPWLVRLRNAVSVVWWLGRDLEAGAVLDISERINAMRETVVFLQHHAEWMHQLLTSSSS
jgi:homoserine kinase type II